MSTLYGRGGGYPSAAPGSDDADCAGAVSQPLRFVAAGAVSQEGRFVTRGFGGRRKGRSRVKKGGGRAFSPSEVKKKGTREVKKTKGRVGRAVEGS